nr:protein CASC3-like isoform X1 [Danaus plexippus plexippus]
MTSVARRREQDDSGEYSDASQDIEQNNSGIDGAQHDTDYDSQGSETEHSEGDPEKQETERRVDDDEDRSNPQYIPKRGTFYEHDDRTAASGEETTNTTSETVSEKKEGVEPPAERRRPPRKADADNKWAHDKYNENEQIPKSRDELVAIYGYDIRNEDAPPHARRNRRYGRYRHWRRGPNKYTRTWEDEEAYRRQLAHKKPPSPADFPELGATNKPGCVV